MFLTEQKSLILFLSKLFIVSSICNHPNKQGRAVIKLTSLSLNSYIVDIVLFVVGGVFSSVEYATGLIISVCPVSSRVPGIEWIFNKHLLK